MWLVGVPVCLGDTQRRCRLCRDLGRKRDTVVRDVLRRNASLHRTLRFGRKAQRSLVRAGESGSPAGLRQRTEGPSLGFEAVSAQRRPRSFPRVTLPFLYRQSDRYGCRKVATTHDCDFGQHTSAERILEVKRPMA